MLPLGTFKVVADKNELPAAVVPTRRKPRRVGQPLSWLFVGKTYGGVLAPSRTLSPMSRKNSETSGTPVINPPIVYDSSRGTLLSGWRLDHRSHSYSLVPLRSVDAFHDEPQACA